MSNNRNNSKKEIKLSELTNIIQELVEDNKKYKEYFKCLNIRVYGGIEPSYEDVIYGNLSDEVLRLSTVVKTMVYNNENEYYNNGRGPNCIEKIKKRAVNKKKGSNLKKNNEEREPNDWQSNY
jgi:hypothetical protein